MRITVILLQIHLSRLSDWQKRNAQLLEKLQLRRCLRSCLVDAEDLDSMTRRCDMQVPVPNLSVSDLHFHTQKFELTKSISQTSAGYSSNYPNI